MEEKVVWDWREKKFDWYSRTVISIAATVVVYTDFKPTIDDEDIYKPIMLTCLAVSRIHSTEKWIRSISCS